MSDPRQAEASGTSLQTVLFGLASILAGVLFLLNLTLLDLPFDPWLRSHLFPPAAALIPVVLAATGLTLALARRIPMVLRWILLLAFFLSAVAWRASYDFAPRAHWGSLLAGVIAYSIVRFSARRPSEHQND